MAKKLENMNVEELEQLNQDLMAEKATILAKQRQVAAVLDAKRAEAAAAAKLAGMSIAERASLAQLLTAEGIGSTEAVGTPGGK